MGVAVPRVGWYLSALRGAWRRLVLGDFLPSSLLESREFHSCLPILPLTALRNTRAAGKCLGAGEGVTPPPNTYKHTYALGAPHTVPFSPKSQLAEEMHRVGKDLERKPLFSVQ